MSQKRARKSKLAWDNNVDLRSSIVSEELLSNNQASISGMEKEEENEIDLRKAADAQANHLMHEIMTPQVNLNPELQFKKKQLKVWQASNENNVPTTYKPMNNYYSLDEKDKASCDTVPITYKVMANFYSLDDKDKAFCDHHKIPYFYMSWFVTMSFHGPSDPATNKKFYNFTGMPFKYYKLIDKYIMNKVNEVENALGVSPELLPVIDRFRQVSRNASYGCFYPRPPKVSTRRKVQNEIKALEHAHDMRANVDTMRIAASKMLIRQEVDLQEALKLRKCFMPSTMVKPPSHRSPPLSEKFDKQNALLSIADISRTCSSSSDKPVNGHIGTLEILKRPPELLNMIGSIVYRILDLLSYSRPRFLGVALYEDHLYPCPAPYDVYFLKVLMALKRADLEYEDDANQDIEPPDYFERGSFEKLSTLASFLKSGRGIVVYDSRLPNFQSQLSIFEKVTMNPPEDLIYLRYSHICKLIIQLGGDAIGNPKFNMFLENGRHLVEDDLHPDCLLPNLDTPFCECRIKNEVIPYLAVDGGIKCDDDEFYLFEAGGFLEYSAPPSKPVNLELVGSLISTGLLIIKCGYSSQKKIGPDFKSLVENSDYKLSEPYVIDWNPKPRDPPSAAPENYLTSVARLKTLLKTNRVERTVFPGFKKGPDYIAKDEDFETMNIQLTQATLMPFAGEPKDKQTEHEIIKRNTYKLPKPEPYRGPELGNLVLPVRTPTPAIYAQPEITNYVYQGPRNEVNTGLAADHLRGKRRKKKLKIFSPSQ